MAPLKNLWLKTRKIANKFGNLRIWKFENLAKALNEHNIIYKYPIHLFGEISRRGEISLKMTNIALVRALRIWVAQRMYWHILPKQGWSYILVKMSIFWKFFFAFSNVKSLSEYVVKILALKFESKKSYGKKKQIFTM